MAKSRKEVPQPVLRRLIKYLMHVQALREEDVEWVASHELADVLGLTSSTVRQDLSHLDFAGVARRGYECSRLEQVLRRELGVGRRLNTIIVGAGNLGRALALHRPFERYGFIIKAVLDSDKRAVGRKIGTLTVQHIDKLQMLVRKHEVSVGMLAIPHDAAQETADRLVEAGVDGILNLTPGHVRTPDSTSVVETRILASLQELSYLMHSG